MKVTDLKHSEFCSIEEATKLFNRIMQRASRIGDCLMWQSGKGESGHARFWFRGRMHQVTHLVWLITKGEVVPKELVVRHKCDVRLCICPNHIELGTQKENMQDAVQRKRHRGHENLKNYMNRKSLNNLEENPGNF